MSQDKPFHPIHRLKGRGGEYYYLIAREARRLKPKHPVLVLGVLISCAVSLIFSRPTQAGNETLTLETYYPAPYGIYNEFTTTGQTILATESGNVGIGTTTPADKLDIEDTKNDAVTVSIRNTQTGDSAESRIYLKGASGEGGGTFTYYNKDYSIAGRSHLADRVAVIGDSLTGGLTLLSTAPSSDMRFFTGGDQVANERMRITGEGNVGIGTITPGAALEVNGGVKIGNTDRCDSDRAGTMRYRPNQGVLYCDGDNWTSKPADCYIKDGGAGDSPRMAKCDTGSYVVSGYCTGTNEHLTQISLGEDGAECTQDPGPWPEVHPHAVCCR